MDGLRAVTVSSPREVHRVLERAAACRAMSRTGCNERSSRSHTVFQLTLHARNTKTGSKRQSILSLVDLAGSERLSDSKTTGERLRETQCINSSLSSLAGCIHAIATNQEHIPFRNSKLTHLLTDSLGGELSCSSRLQFHTHQCLVCYKRICSLRLHL